MAKLKEIRLKRGLSQSELAKYMGTSKRSIEAYEQGQRDFSSAKLTVILKACTILNCTIREMFEDDETITNLIIDYEKQQ